MEDALILEGDAWFGSGGQRKELFVGCFDSQTTRNAPARSCCAAPCDPLNELPALRAALAGCGKTISAQQAVDGLHVWVKKRTPRRLLRNGLVL